MAGVWSQGSLAAGEGAVVTGSTTVYADEAAATAAVVGLRSGADQVVGCVADAVAGWLGGTAGDSSLVLGTYPTRADESVSVTGVVAVGGLGDQRGGLSVAVTVLTVRVGRVVSMLSGLSSGPPPDAGAFGSALDRVLERSGEVAG